MTRTWSFAALGQPGGSVSLGGRAGSSAAATGSAGAGTTGAGLGGDSASTMSLNSVCPSCCARSSSAGVRMRWRVWLRWLAVLASAVSAPRLVWRSNSAVIANQASAAAASLGAASPRSWMSPSVNIDAAMPWRAAERSRSTASLPSRGAPLPSRSSRARLCLAAGRLAVMALRYHSMARAESRSTTKPRSYITATLKADCAEPRWAARNSQPAPACWSLVTPTPWTSRRASSSIAGISLAVALARSSSIGIATQSMGLGGSTGTVDAIVDAAADGSALRATSMLVSSGGAGASGTTIEAVLGEGARAGDGADDASPASRLSAVSAGCVNQTPAEPAPTSMSTTAATPTGRFASDVAAASNWGQLSLPVILQP